MFKLTNNFYSILLDTLMNDFHFLVISDTIFLFCSAYTEIFFGSKVQKIPIDLIKYSKPLRNSFLNWSVRSAIKSTDSLNTTTYYLNEYKSFKIFLEVRVNHIVL